MRAPLLHCCLLLLVVCGSGARQADAAPRLDKKAVEKLAKAFCEARPWSRFEEWDVAKRRAFLEEAAAVEFPAEAFGEVRDILFKAANKAAPKWKGEMETPYGTATWIQKGKGGPKAPLVIGLHGGGENAGSAGEAAGNWSVPKTLGIYPQGVRLVSDTWNTVHGERFVLSLIDWAKAKEEIDPDRVMVMGFSMGGTGSFHFAGRWPDRFADAVPAHGVVMAEKVKEPDPAKVGPMQFGLVPNMRNLIVYIYTGSLDKNCEPGTFHRAWQEIESLRQLDDKGWQGVQFARHENLAHAFPPGEPGKGIAVAMAAKRDAFPDTVVWEYAVEPYPLPDAKDKATRLVQRSFYWLRCKDPRNRMSVRAVKQLEGDTLVVTLETAGVQPDELEILLNPTMLGAAVKIRVEAGGKTYEGEPKPSLATLFDTFDERVDRTLLFDRVFEIGAAR